MVYSLKTFPKIMCRTSIGMILFASTYIEIILFFFFGNSLEIYVPTSKEMILSQVTTVQSKKEERENIYYHH